MARKTDILVKPSGARPSALLSTLRLELAAVADPTKAAGMKAYMKSDMPYHGAQAPLVAAVCRKIFASLELEDESVWQEQVRAIWHGARFREERYCAITLTGHRKARAFQTPKAALPLYEELIVSGAWWDYVDVLASRRLGPLLESHPAVLRKEMLGWSKCDDLWKRRSAILCQLSFGPRTDFDFLQRCIEPSLDSGEFFLRKAIGWALRQLAWSRPDEVVAYVRAQGDRLSSLSRREALKNVLKAKGRP